MEVPSRPFLSIGRLSVRITDRLPLILIGQIPPTRFAMHEKKVIFPILHFGLLLDGRHEAFLIVEKIAPEVPCLA